MAFYEISSDVRLLEKRPTPFHEKTDDEDYYSIFISR